MLSVTTRRLSIKHFLTHVLGGHTTTSVPFGVTYVKIGTIQRRLAWPLHKDDTLSRSGRPTGLNIYFVLTLMGVYTSRRAKVSRAGIRRSRPTLPSPCLRSRFHLPTLPSYPSL